MEVSIIIPVYNAAEYVAQAVESALVQPQAAEVLLIDDGSRDESLAVCRSLAECDARVKVLQHPGGKNRGVSASRNLGIAAAGSEYIAFLDADDWYLPGRFEVAQEVFATEPLADGVYDAVGTAYEDGQVGEWYRTRQDPELITLAEPVPPEQLFETLVTGTKGFFCTDGIVVRKLLFERTGGFDMSLRMGEDTAMWVRMSVLGRLFAGSLHEPVGMRRLHTQNTIYQAREHNAHYAVLMAESLLAWAPSVELSPARTVLLLDWLLNFGMHDLSGERSQTPYVGRKLDEISYFAKFAWTHPLAMRSGHYWSVIAASLGVRRVIRSLRRSRHQQGSRVVRAAAQ